MQPHDKEFKKLRDEWYAKLKAEGFKDIESDSFGFNIWSVSRFSPGLNNGHSIEATMQHNKAKEEYYRIAGHFLYDYPFEDELERLIWELHAEGVSYLAIIKKLRSNGIKRSKDYVGDVIKRMRSEMVRYYGR